VPFRFSAGRTFIVVGRLDLAGLDLLGRCLANLADLDLPGNRPAGQRVVSIEERRAILPNFGDRELNEIAIFVLSLNASSR
jgi:hypothetical protein